MPRWHETLISVRCADCEPGYCGESAWPADIQAARRDDVSRVDD